MVVVRKNGLDPLYIEAFELVGGNSVAEGLVSAGNLWCVCGNKGRYTSSGAY